MTTKILFLTGNANKKREVEQILINQQENSQDLVLESCSIDLTEIQGPIEEVVADKGKRAYDYLKANNMLDNTRMILTEDVGLEMDGLNGLPGVYVKWFLKSLGVQGLFDLVANKDRGSKAICAVCLVILNENQDIEKILTHKGSVEGFITEPKDASSFGWDPIFTPKGFQVSYAGMKPEEKNAISHRRKAMEWVKQVISEYTT